MNENDACLMCGSTERTPNCLRDLNGRHRYADGTCTDREGRRVVHPTVRLLRRFLPLFGLAAAVLLLAGCSLNKYDTYDSCELSDGRYQIVVSISHDSSEPKESSAPATYAKLCREIVGGPGVHIDRPAP